MKKNVLLLMILGLMISLMGCRTPMQTSSTSPSEDSGKANDNGPAILFVSGTISFDSIANAYHIKIDKQEKFPGQINVGIAEDMKEPEGLNNVQLDANDAVLSRQRMDNPLIQRMEYPDGEEFKIKNVIKKEADLFLRLQLDRKTEKLQFCNNQDVIETITIE